MESIKIEQYNSPYSKRDLNATNLTSPIIAAGGACCSTCCCCTSSFIIPEAIILASTTSKSTKKEIFKKYQAIYGTGFAIIFILGLVIALFGQDFDTQTTVLFAIGIPGVAGALLINPIVVGVKCQNAKENISSHERKIHEEITHCGHCGTNIDKGSNVCTNCGKEISKAIMTSTQISDHEKWNKAPVGFYVFLMGILYVALYSIVVLAIFFARS